MYVSYTFPKTRKIDTVETVGEAEFFYQNKVLHKTKTEKLKKNKIS